MFLFFILFLASADNLKIDAKVVPPFFEQLDSKILLKEKAKFKAQKQIFNFMLGVAYFNEGNFVEANKFFNLIKKINYIDDYVRYYKAYSACKVLKKSKNFYSIINELHIVLSEGKGSLPQKTLEAVKECELKFSKILIDENKYEESLKYLILSKDRGYKNLDDEFYIYQKYLKFNFDLAVSFLKALSKQYGESADLLFKKLDSKVYNLITEETKKNTVDYNVRKYETNFEDELNSLNLIIEDIKTNNVLNFKNDAISYIKNFPFGTNVSDFYKKSNTYIFNVLEAKTKDINYFNKLLLEYSSLEQMNILLQLWKKMDLENSEKIIILSLKSNPNYDKANYLAASFYEDTGKLDKAISFYKKIVTGFGGSSYYHRALFKNAWLEMFNKKYKKSLDLFNRYLAEGEDKEKWDITAALYYKAQIHKKLNEVSIYEETLYELLTCYPYAFYSCLAREELGLSLVNDLKSLENKTVQNVQAITASELFIFNRAIILIKAGLLDDAGKELSKININNLSPKYKELLASIYRNSKTPQLAITISYNLLFSFKEYLSRTHAENHFPTLYFDLVDYYSKISGVEPFLVLSVMKRESAFNKEAVSSAGAMGLLQMLPSLAKELDPNIEKNNLKNPNDNIKVAVKHLSDLYKKYNGNLVYMLAAYNAGEEALTRWQKWYGERLNTKEFIESISYAETRDYVKAVLSYYYMYNAIYNGKDLKFSELINENIGGL